MVNWGRNFSSSIQTYPTREEPIRLYLSPKAEDTIELSRGANYGIHLAVETGLSIPGSNSKALYN